MFIMLAASDVLILHETILEPNQLEGHDIAKLESCLGRLAQHVHYDSVEDIFEAGAILAEAIALSHSFSDGNKRTALMSMVIFFIINGGKTPNLAGTEAGIKIENMVTHDLSPEEFADWLRGLPELKIELSDDDE